MSDGPEYPEAGDRLAAGPDVRAVITAEIRRWVTDGILSARTGQRLLAEYEPEYPTAPSTPTEERWPRVRIPLTPRMGLLYLGGLLVFCAAVILVGQVWEDVGASGRLALLLAPTVGLYLAGALTRRSGAEARARSDVLLFFGAALLPFAVGLGAQWAGGPDAATTWWLWAVASLATLAGHVATLTLFRSPLLTLPYTGSAVWTAFAVTQWVVDDLLETADSALAFVAAGCALLAVGLIERRREHPTFAFAPDLVGAGCALIGMFAMATTGVAAWEACSVAACVGMLGASVALRNQTYLLCGAVALMLNIFQIGFEHFGETIGVPATLVACGCLCVAMGFLVQRVRKGQVSLGS